MTATDRNKRRLLQAITLGGAVATTKSLPETWMRPAVEALVVPTHAQTTTTATGATAVEFGQNNVQIAGIITTPEAQEGLLAGIGRSVLGGIAPSAQAQFGVGTEVHDDDDEDVTVDIFVRTSGDNDNAVDVRVVITSNGSFEYFESTGLTIGEQSTVAFQYADDSCGLASSCTVIVTAADTSAIGTVTIDETDEYPFNASPMAWPAPPLAPKGCI